MTKNKLPRLPKFWAKSLHGSVRFSREYNFLTVNQVAGFTEKMSLLLGMLYFTITWAGIMLLVLISLIILKTLGVSNEILKYSLLIASVFSLITASIAGRREFLSVRKGITIKIPTNHKGVLTIGETRYEQGLEEGEFTFPNVQSILGFFKGAYIFGAIPVFTGQETCQIDLKNINSSDKIPLIATASYNKRVSNIYIASGYSNQERTSIIKNAVQAGAKTGLARIPYEKIVSNKTSNGFDDATKNFYEALGDASMRNINYVSPEGEVISHEEFLRLPATRQEEIQVKGWLRLEDIGEDIEQAFIEDAVAASEDDREAAGAAAREILKGEGDKNKVKIINQMIKSLINEGHTPEEARAKAERLAGYRPNEFFLNADGTTDSISTLAAAILAKK
jgi:hypothetical protein